jgi:hypothetical protein
MKCDMHDSDVQLHYTPSMGRRFIEISDCFERFPTLFFRTNFLDIRFVLLVCFLFLF